MEFTKNKLEQISWSGMYGQTFTSLATDLGLMPTELRNERLKNSKLNEALLNYEYNRDQYMAGKMMEAVLSKDKNLLPRVYVEVIKYLNEK